MRFELKVNDSAAKELFAKAAKSLQRFGATKLIDKTIRSSGRRGESSADGYLTIIASKTQTTRYVCQAKQKLDANSLASISERLGKAASTFGAKPLLVAPYITDSMGERLRTDGIAYIDGAGNACLIDLPVYIWTQGFKPTQRPERVTRAFQATGLQLIALLLSHPGSVEWPYRMLAEDAGLSLGSTSRIFGELRSLGFIKLVAPGRSALVDRHNLLEHWQFGYATRLRPRLNPQTYRLADRMAVEELAEGIPPSMKDDVLVGGELAAAIATGHLRPQTAAFHCSDVARQPLVKALKLIPDPNGNVILLEQFGKLPVWAWDKHKDKHLADPFLLHGELMHGRPDDRILEAANLIFTRYLAPIIDHEPTEQQ